MEKQFLNEKIKYDGKQLASHWIMRKTAIPGDAIVAFTGPAHVELTEMVDLEDVKRGVGIKSANMIHFLIEHFGGHLNEAVWRQRLFISICADELRSAGISNIRRCGDDLFVDDRKLSVSIATASPISSLIHTGINIDPKGAPVKACGLKEWKVNPKKFADNIMSKYMNEVRSANWARCKVKPVS